MNLNSDEEDEAREEIYSFDLPSIPFISNADKRHKAIAKLLGLGDDKELHDLFIIISTIVDPMTQPMENNSTVVSLEQISRLIIALCYNKDSITAEFDLSIQLFKVVESSLKLLNCDDDIKLRNLNNSDLKVDWRLRLKEWTPHGINDQDLRLIYMINCASIYTIYRLYEVNEKDLCLNPFLGFFLKLWKIFTNLVLLGLEIDRRVEPMPDQNTPNTVKQVIRGSSAMRYILASILNDDFENRLHDYSHINILDFLSPYGRKCGSGTLYADVRWYVGAMLALGSELNEVVETLVDLEPNDRYDEDVRYMFDYEYDDHHHDLLYPEDYDENGVPLRSEPLVYEDEDGHFHRVMPKRCDCVFFDEEVDEEGIEDTEYENGTNGVESRELGIGNEEFGDMPHAIRSTEADIEFDELGRDWRDIPREGNIFFNSQVKLNEDSCYNWPELSAIFDKMTNEPIPDEESQKAIFTIARAVKLEFEQEISNQVSSEKKKDESEEEQENDIVTPDKIYMKWSYYVIFEQILALNPDSAYAMLDEMFMANGYRRVLIWFITHLALSFSLMNYIYELITGLRGEGNKERKSKFIFSRQGPLVLSEVEKQMLLHEFLNNCLVFISKNYESFQINEEIGGLTSNSADFDKCVKIIKLICLMVNKLISKEMIDIEEYKVELTSLLINWIGAIPEAKTLFFEINNTKDSESIEHFKSMMEAEFPSPTKHGIKQKQSQFLQLQKAEKKQRKFNNDLKVSLNNVVKKLDSGALLLKIFFDSIGNGEIEEQDPKSEDQIIGFPFLKLPHPATKVNYIPGKLHRLQRDEEYEHDKIEHSIR